MNKKALSERDICTKFITPALKQSGWDELSQIREVVSFTKGRIIVRGRLVTRDKAKRADYILYYKPNILLAIIEASHGLRPRPADLFEHELPSVWLLNDTRRTPRRDVIGLFNWESKEQTFDVPLDRLVAGLSGPRHTRPASGHFGSADPENTS